MILPYITWISSHIKLLIGGPTSRLTSLTFSESLKDPWKMNIPLYSENSKHWFQFVLDHEHFPCVFIAAPTSSCLQVTAFVSNSSIYTTAGPLDPFVRVIWPFLRNIRCHFPSRMVLVGRWIKLPQSRLPFAAFLCYSPWISQSSPCPHQ